MNIWWYALVSEGGLHPPIFTPKFALAAVGFQAFSALHFWTVAGCAAVMAVTAAAGIYLRGQPGAVAEARLRRAVGGFALILFLFSTSWNLLPQNRDWEVSLPLQFCDLGLLVAAGALWLNAQWLRGLLYFWGTVFTLQAFATPVLQDGPDTVNYWLFWSAHTGITGAAVYDLVVGKFRPTFAEAVRSYIISVGYAMLLLVLDNCSGCNYGYVGPAKPGTPTLLDVLGPYPMRVGWMAVVAAVGFLIAWLPWACVKKRR